MGGWRPHILPMPSTSTLISSFLLIAVAAMALVLWAAQGGTNEDGLLIAVFPPTASERTIMHAVVEAEGSFVRASLPETIIIAHSTQPGFADRLKAQGAWLTYSDAPFGNGLAGCLALATVPFERADTSIR
jgi:hypothetical protein